MKKISIINYYTYPLKISFLEKTFTVDRFSILTTEIATKDDFYVEAKNDNGDVIKGFQVSPVGYRQQIIVSVLAPDDNYCYFGANVKNLYYTTSESLGREELDNVSVLSSSPKDYILKNLEVNDSSLYIYPGYANINYLPKETKSQKVYGLYPILCSDIQNSDNFLSVAKFYATYDAKAQQEYYDNSKKKIDESTNSSDLQNLTID